MAQVSRKYEHMFYLFLFGFPPLFPEGICSGAIYGFTNYGYTDKLGIVHLLNVV